MQHEELAGRLEPIIMLAQNEQRSPVPRGILLNGGISVSVPKGATLGKKGVVLLHREWKNSPTGTLVRRSIPRHFNGKSPEQFVLFGVLPKYRRSWFGFVPTLNEINHYFNVDNMGYAGYIAEQDGAIKMATIGIKNGRQVIRNYFSLRELVSEGLPDPRTSSRFVVIDYSAQTYDPSQIRNIKEEIKENGLYGLRVDPILE